MTDQVESNQDKFVRICQVQGHKINRKKKLSLEYLEVILSVRKQVEIRRLKILFEKEEVRYGMGTLGKNTRYRVFTCRLD